MTSNILHAPLRSLPLYLLIAFSVFSHFLTVAVAEDSKISIYFSTNSPDTIQKVYYPGGTPSKLLEADDTISALAYDTSTQSLLYAEGNEIKEVAIDGSGAKTLLSLSAPGFARDIVISPDGDFLYWANGNAHSIQRSKRDGSQLETLFSLEDTQIPSGLALSSDNETLYITDGAAVSKCSLIAKTCTVIIQKGFPIKVRVDEEHGHLYWINNLDKTIHRALIDGSNDAKITSPSDGTLLNLHIHSSQNTIYWSNFDGHFPATFFRSIKGTGGSITTLFSTPKTAAEGLVLIADRDIDGSPDDIDHCPDDSSKQLPGQCGCHQDDTDSDNNGIADCVDLCTGVSDTAPCSCNVAFEDSNGNNILDCFDILRAHAVLKKNHFKNNSVKLRRLKDRMTAMFTLAAFEELQDNQQRRIKRLYRKIRQRSSPANTRQKLNKAVLAFLTFYQDRTM